MVQLAIEIWLIIYFVFNTLLICKAISNDVFDGKSTFITFVSLSVVILFGGLIWLFIIMMEINNKKKK